MRVIVDAFDVLVDVIVDVLNDVVSVKISKRDNHGITRKHVELAPFCHQLKRRQRRMSNSEMDIISISPRKKQRDDIDNLIYCSMWKFIAIYVMLCLLILLLLSHLLHVVLSQNSE